MELPFRQEEEKAPSVPEELQQLTDKEGDKVLNAYLAVPLPACPLARLPAARLPANVPICLCSRLCFQKLGCDVISGQLVNHIWSA